MSGEEEEIEVTIDMAELKRMKVPELKRKLTELGLPNKGTKADLLARIEKYLHEQEEEDLLEDEEIEDQEQEVGEQEVEEQEAGVEDGAEDTITKQAPSDSNPPPEKQPTVAVETETTPTSTVDPTPSDAVTTTGNAASVSTTKKLSSIPTPAADRLAVRAQRFGANNSEEAKKLARAERFGTTLENGFKGLGKRAPPSESELAKMKKRAERFGSSVSPHLTNAEEDERKKKRLERFGTNVTELNLDERKKARAARFGQS